MAVAAVALVARGLGDRRRVQRLTQLVASLAERWSQSLPKALARWAPLKAAYRFFDNRNVTPAGMLAAAWPACREQLPADGPVLLIQDTTTITIKRSATQDLGPVGNGQGRGLLLHSVLAASAAGTPIGVPCQLLWTRDADGPHRDSRRQRPIEEKESYRWLDLEQQSLASLPPGVPAITVADREADSCELFAQARPAHAYLLIRAAQSDRSVDADGGKLAARLAQQPVLGSYTLEVAPTPKRTGRQARCEVRLAPVVLQPPQNRAAGSPRLAPVPVTAILASELAAPPEEEPLRWLLLTSWPVRSFADARQVLVWYSCRWLIERFHFVLKTGCGVEELQLRTAARLENASSTDSLVAARLLWLTYLAREQPAAPCSLAFTQSEWETLVCMATKQARPPSTPPSLREAVRLVAKLGGFLARKGDGEPGPTALWTGLQRLADYVAARTLFQPPPPVTGSG